MLLQQTTVRMCAERKGDVMSQKAHEIFLVFGEDNARLVADHKWAKMDDQPVRYAFNTDAELMAFCAGVDVAIGWHDCASMDRDMMRAYRRAIAQRAKRAGYKGRGK